MNDDVGPSDDGDDSLGSVPELSMGGGGCACATTGALSPATSSSVGWLAALGLVTASRLWGARRRKEAAQKRA